MIKPFFSRMLSLFVMFSILVSCLCACNLNTVDSKKIHLEKMITEYKKNKTTKNLANVIVASMNDLNLNYINTYGDDFLFSSEKEELYNEFASAWFEMNSDFTNVSISNLYESLLWMYMFSFLYDTQANQSIYYIDNKLEIDKIYPSCMLLLKERNASAEQGILVANKILDEVFLCRFLGTVKLAVEDEEEEIKNYAYKILWEIAFSTNNQELGQFFTCLYGNNSYTDNNYKIKNPEGKGQLVSLLSIENLKAQLDFITETSNVGYDDMVSCFSCYPKEFLTGKYYSYNYYSPNYVISFYGSPIHSISISDIKTGEILYMKYKLPSTSGLEWHK